MQNIIRGIMKTYSIKELKIIGEITKEFDEETKEAFIILLAIKEGRF